MKIVACYSIKGGVGKTATAINLAYAAAQDGLRTLICDLDPQGASSYYFRVRPSTKLKADTFFTRRDRLVRNIKGSDYPRLDILPANLAYRDFDQMLAGMKKSRLRLSQLLHSLSDEYDLVVLDCPPNITIAESASGFESAAASSRSRPKSAYSLIKSWVTMSFSSALLTT